jgi:hypothetical protein
MALLAAPTMVPIQIIMKRMAIPYRIIATPMVFIMFSYFILA